MAFLNVKIGQIVQKLWPRKVRLSQMTHEKVRFFSAHQVSKIHKKYLEWEKNCRKRGFWCKKPWGIHWSWFQSSISSHLGWNWEFMQITLRTALQKMTHYHTLTPLNPPKTCFETPKLLLKDCLPLASNTPHPHPPFFSLLAAFWPLILTHFPPPWGSTTPFHSLSQALSGPPLQKLPLHTRPIGSQIITDYQSTQFCDLFSLVPMKYEKKRWKKAPFLRPKKG